MCIRDRIQTVEMKLLRAAKKCTRRDRIRNEEIRSDLDIFTLNERIKEYRIRSCGPSVTGLALLPNADVYKRQQ